MDSSSTTTGYSDSAAIMEGIAEMRCLSLAVHAIFQKYAIIFMLYATQPYSFLYYRMKGLIKAKGGTYDGRKNHRIILGALRDRY